MPKLDVPSRNVLVCGVAGGRRRSANRLGVGRHTRQLAALQQGGLQIIVVTGVEDLHLNLRDEFGKDFSIKPRAIRRMASGIWVR